MIVSSVYFWMEQIRYRTEVYDCNSLEQRKIRKCNNYFGRNGRTMSAPFIYQNKENNFDSTKELGNNLGPSLENLNGSNINKEQDNVDNANDEKSFDLNIHKSKSLDDLKLDNLETPLKKWRFEGEISKNLNRASFETNSNLMKVKSLDSLLDTIKEEGEVETVELRRNNGSSKHPDHRKGWIYFDDKYQQKSDYQGRRHAKNPLLKRFSAHGILETISEASENTKKPEPCYENLWECETLLRNIKYGDINRVSVNFDETVEELVVEPSVLVKNDVKFNDSVLFWINELATAYCYEEDLPLENFYQNRFSPQTELKFQNEQYARSSPPKNNDPILQSISMSNHSLSSKTSLTSSVFEKCTKLSIDGKTTKLNKNEKIQVENNNLIITDDKGNLKQTLKSNLDQFTKEDKNAKEFILKSNTSVIKVYKDVPIADRRNFLQKFFPKRTSKEDLVRKGIYKNEPIFGNTLAYLADKYHRPVPEIVTKIIELIELPKNITSQGVYRASGNVATIQKIRLKVDSYKFTVLEDYKNDVDVLAGALKMFFRELKESLIGKKEYERLVKILNFSPNEQYKAVGDVINSLSTPHKETLKVILEHLLKIAEHEEKNHMSITGLAICWAQSIICFEDTSMNRDNVLEIATNKNAIFTLLLNTYKSTFVSSLKPADSILSFQSECSYPCSSTKDLHRSHSVETGSIQSFNTNIMPINDTTFIYALMQNIESKNIEKGIYKEVPSRVVEKIYEKCSKRKSKTLFQRLEKATLHELCLLLKKIVKNRQPPIFPAEVFDDITNSIGTMETEMLHKKILTDISNLPQKDMIDRLFNHFHIVMKKSSDPVTLHYEISEYWVDVFCKTMENDNLKMKTKCIFVMLDAFAPEQVEDYNEELSDITEEININNSTRIPDCSSSLEMICCNTNSNRESTYEYVKNN